MTTPLDACLAPTNPEEKNGMDIQWLLVGGPCDGKTLWIKQGSRVNCEGTVYQGQNYLHNGRLYRVGHVDPNDLETGRVAGLIDETKLRHIAGS